MNDTNFGPDDSIGDLCSTEIPFGAATANSADELGNSVLILDATDGNAVASLHGTNAPGLANFSLNAHNTVGNGGMLIVVVAPLLHSVPVT